MIPLGIALRHVQSKDVRVPLRPVRARMAASRLLLPGLRTGAVAPCAAGREVRAYVRGRKGNPRGAQGLPQVQEPVLECPSSRASRGVLSSCGVPDKGRGWGASFSLPATLCGTFCTAHLRTMELPIPAAHPGTWREYNTRRKAVHKPPTQSRTDEKNEAEMLLSASALGGGQVSAFDHTTRAALGFYGQPSSFIGNRPLLGKAVTRSVAAPLVIPSAVEGPPIVTVSVVAGTCHHERVPLFLSSRA
jgi:hypothetical protein